LISAGRTDAARNGNEGLAVEFIDFVDSADVRMIQRGGGARLALESLQGLVIIGKTFGQRLERRHRASRECDR
jgi:hypothetical protein